MSVRCRSIWNLERLVSGERGKPEHPEKNLSARKRTNNKPTLSYTWSMKRYPFRSEPTHKSLCKKYPPPPPPGKEASPLTTAPPLRSFRRKPIQLLYLYKKVSSFMSISLIHNNYFAMFVPVNFLIRGNVTLGLMFAVCRKRDSISLDFPLNGSINLVS